MAIAIMFLRKTIICSLIVLRSRSCPEDAIFWRGALLDSHFQGQKKAFIRILITFTWSKKGLLYKNFNWHDPGAPRMHAWFRKQCVPFSSIMHNEKTMIKTVFRRIVCFFYQIQDLQKTAVNHTILQINILNFRFVLFQRLKYAGWER